jgi:hypothetical protein
MYDVVNVSLYMYGMALMKGWGEKSKKRAKKHTTVGIRWWSPTQLLIYRFQAYVWQSGRDAQFS